jgi:uncharacterized cupredoxin-like copper-binding protein
MKRSNLWFALVLGVVLLGACAGTDREAVDQENMSITVTARDIVFEPESLTVKSGQRIRLTLENEGALLHDFSIAKMPLHENASADDLSEPQDEEGAMRDGESSDKDEMHNTNEHTAGMVVHVAAEGGKNATIEFTPDEPGVYRYVCTVEGHEAAGMVGELVVED